jgi:hypothetical protein
MCCITTLNNYRSPYLKYGKMGKKLYSITAKEELLKRKVLFFLFWKFDFEVMLSLI